MLIEPLITEADSAKLATVGRDAVVLSHRLDMTGAFDDSAVKAYIDSHPSAGLVLFPAAGSSNQGLAITPTGDDTFSNVVMQSLGVKLEQVTVHHTVLEEITEQLRIELEEKTRSCLHSTVDLFLLPKSMEIQFSSDVEYVLNIYGRLEVTLDCERRVVVGNDQLLSSFPHQVTRLVGRDDVNLLLTSNVSGD